MRLTPGALQPRSLLLVPGVGGSQASSKHQRRARAPRELKAATAKHAEATEPPKRLTPAQRAPASSTRTARAEGGDGQARRSHRAAEATHAASTESASVEHAHRAS